MIPLSDKSKNKINSGLYIVSTPIGNLSDITLRALDVLKNSEYILCEDTRTSKKLLDKFGFNDLYNLILNRGEKTSSITLIWLIKRCLQKIGIRSRKKLIKFQEDPTANDTKLFTNPKMSILAKKLLTYIHLK